MVDVDAFVAACDRSPRLSREASQDIADAIVAAMTGQSPSR